ncbi:MAG TPA: DMT family transporter [Chitinophagaceae bacterium]
MTGFYDLCLPAAAGIMNNKVISWSIFVLLCFIWGSSFILMKVSQKGLNAPQIAALRIFSAALVFLPFAFFHITKLPRRKMGLIFLAGFFGNLFPAFCFAFAILKIDSSLAGILNSLTPICVATIGISFFKDKIKTQKLIGVLVGFAGLCLLTFTQKDISFDNLGYALLVIAGTLSYGINVNLVSHHLKEVNPIHLATVSLGFMAIPAGLILWQQGFTGLDFTDTVIQWAIINSSLLGIVASAFATLIFYMLVQKAGGLFASLVTYGIPFIALFWGFMDGESITFIEIISLGIILLGVYLANRPEKKETGN